jgi:PAS domain S-box-containing protein
MFESAMCRWISEHSNQGVLVTDTDLSIRFCNRLIERWTGKKASDIVGASLLDVFPEIESRGFADYYRAALAGESRVLSHGLHKYLLSTRNPGRTSTDPSQTKQSGRIAALEHGGNIIGTITVIEDVTERVEREAELSRRLEEREKLLASELEARRLAEDNSRVKDEFLATVSHEIRSPLNAIRGWTLILRGEPDQETLRHALDTIDRNVVSQSQIIEDLLDISRMVSGQLKLEMQPIDLVDVVAAAVDNISPTAEAKEVEVVTTLEPSPIFVTGDGDRIQQVLWNLLSNAIKFTPAGGSVKVSVRADSDSAELVVRDDGIGIPNDFLPFVFDRFRQADGGKKRRHGGLGLGMSIVKNLVEMHDGSISVQSPGEGQGTAFTIKIPRLLPLHGVEQTDELTNEAHDSVRSLRMLKCRIMIVDDDDDSREMLKILLSTRNAEVLAAGSAMECLAQFTAFRPDILISDLGMPEMDGYDLIKQVRSLSAESGGDVPAIALTGYVSVEEQKRVRASGFDSHIAKPLDQSILVQTISELLDRT